MSCLRFRAFGQRGILPAVRNASEGNGGTEKPMPRLRYDIFDRRSDVLLKMRNAQGRPMSLRDIRQISSFGYATDDL